MMKNKHLSLPLLIVAVAWFALGLAACQPVRPVTELPVAPAAAPALAAEEQAIAEASSAFVATAQDLSPAALSVVSVEAVDWPDAALGCPQPDMVYAAVITPGYRVVLQVADTQYIVHTDSRVDGEKIICPAE